MIKYIEITFPNGEAYTVAAEVVATDRVKYFASEDGFTEGSKEWNNSMEAAMDDYNLEDWAVNNMDWKDLKPYAVKLRDPDPPNYERMWSDARVETRRKE